MFTRLLGCLAVALRLFVAHGPWNVNLFDFQQHLLFSLCPHITVPILASQMGAMDTSKSLEIIKMNGFWFSQREIEKLLIEDGAE